MNIYTRTFIITSLIFGIGVFFGYWLGSERINELEQVTSQLQNTISEAELQFLLINTASPSITCTYLSQIADNLIKETESLGRQVELSENAQKMNTEEFKVLKRHYTLTLIKDWITLEKIKSTCNRSYVMVLYFYSNKNCDRCEDQGIILSYFKQKLDQDIMIFAIDTDLDLNVVNSLLEAYGITGYPAVVINNKPINGYKNLGEIQEVICKENNKLSICQKT